MTKVLPKRLQAKVDEAKKKKVLKQLKTTNLLAIDPATRLGWAVSTDMYGTFDLTTRRDESSGMKLLRFRSKLQELLKLNEVTIVAFERPSGVQANGLISHAKFVAIIETVCLEQKVEYRGYSASEIKKFATGKGNANKQKMLEAAKEKFGYPGNDDNEADALFILSLLKHDLNID